MDDAQRRRVEVLVDLIGVRVPVDAGVDAVEHLAWDSDVELVVLTRQRARALLHAYVRGAVSAAEVKAWAETLEGRDDVGYEVGHSEDIRDFLFEAGTPEINEPITLDFAHRWLRLLHWDATDNQRSDLDPLPRDVRESATILYNGEVEWPLTNATLAVNALAAAGFVVLGLDVRLYDPDGEFVEVAWSSFEPSTGRNLGDQQRACATAVAALDRAAVEFEDSYDVRVLVAWGAAGEHS